jgi:hypothetical protein
MLIFLGNFFTVDFAGTLCESFRQFSAHLLSASQSTSQGSDHGTQKSRHHGSSRRCNCPFQVCQ